MSEVSEETKTKLVAQIAEFLVGVREEDVEVLVITGSHGCYAVTALVPTGLVTALIDDDLVRVI